MNKIKKLSAIMLFCCMLVSNLTVTALAADGTLMFSDPETKAGERVGVDLVVNGGDAALGDVEVNVRYDTSMLEFIEGENVSAGEDGILTYRVQGSGNETEYRTTLYFTALKAGDTTLSVEGSTAYLYSDETLNLTEGSSAIKIAEGENVAQETSASDAEDVPVTVDGTQYTLSDHFSEALIPEGYTETTVTYGGAERKFVVNETNTVYLGYLLDASGNGAFFLYDSDKASFSPYVEYKLSDTTSIVLLNDDSAISLPERYQETTLTINDAVFPVWQDMEQQTYYIVYAVNNNGTKSLYQYDSEEQTYQRIEIQAEQDENETDSSLLGTIQGVVDQFFPIVFAVVVAVLILMLVIIIVVAVKLVHCNQELDELYGEDKDNGNSNHTGGTSGNKKDNLFIVQDDDDDDYMEEDYEEEESYRSGGNGYDEADDDEDYDDGDYDDDDDDDDDDSFDIDFIDL